MKNSYYKLMLVTQCGSTPTETYLDFVTQCTQGGITALQLREKSMPYDKLVALGYKLKEILAPYSIPLIVNDSIEVALEIDADGVHLGQTDGDPFEAKKRLGPKKLIGVSINYINELKAGNIAPINYVGIGAVFPTTNKRDVATVWGLSGIQKLARLSQHPTIAIGGITVNNATQVMQAGASGIAVIGAIHNAQNPKATAQALRNAIGEGATSTQSLQCNTKP